MTTMSQITSLPIFYSTVYSRRRSKKHQSSASLAFVRGIHRWPVNSPHKWPVTRKMFPFDDVIMRNISISTSFASSGNLLQRPILCFYKMKTRQMYAKYLPLIYLFICEIGILYWCMIHFAVMLNNPVYMQWPNEWFYFYCHSENSLCHQRRPSRQNDDTPLPVS